MPVSATEQAILDLTTRLNSALSRIAQLEAQVADHQGIDSGLTGLNYPHPNQKVWVVEYGGGIMRLSPNGAIFKSGGDQVAYLYFLEEMSATPNDQVGVAAGASISSGILGRQGFVIEAAPGLTGFPGSQLNNFVGLILDYNRDGLQIAGVRGISAEDGVSTLVEALIEVGDGPTYTNAQHFRISGGPLLLEGDTSDLTAAVAGMFGYRTDTTKPRLYDGAWKNIALEDWVTTAIAAPATTWALTGDITPAQITSNQDNYNPTGLSSASVLRLATDASRDITG